MSDNEQYPRGKLNADDEGQLQLAVGVQDKTLIIDFGKQVVWLGLDYFTAVEFAKTILRRAEEIAPPEKRSGKPILCVDFDGVIHGYSKGWQGGAIYDDAVPGFFEWLSATTPHFTVAIYSSRSKTESGISAMREWMKIQAEKQLGDAWLVEDTLKALEFASEKPPAFLTIDDRAIRFDGDWSKLDPETLRAFKPWNVAS